jgi:hypothetical protein
VSSPIGRTLGSGALLPLATAEAEGADVAIPDADGELVGDADALGDGDALGEDGAGLPCASTPTADSRSIAATKGKIGDRRSNPAIARLPPARDTRDRGGCPDGEIIFRAVQLPVRAMARSGQITG